MVRFGRPAFRLRGTPDDKAYAAFNLSVLWIVFFGIVPIVAAIVVGMIQGTIAEDVTVPTPDYPAFPLLSCALVVPALALAILFIRTFTWPLKAIEGIRRYEIASMSLIGLTVMMSSTALDQDHLPRWAAQLNFWAMGVYLAVFVLAFARAAAGSLRLVPRSWREEPAKPKRRRRS